MTSEQRAEIVEAYAKYLREIFDESRVDFVSLNIIAEAQRLGYNELVETMKSDLSISGHFFDTPRQNMVYIEDYLKRARIKQLRANLTT